MKQVIFFSLLVYFAIFLPGPVFAQDPIVYPAEGQSQDLVRREGDVTQAEGVEEAVVDAPVPALAHDGEAGEHQRVEVAVDGSEDALELFRELIQAHPAPALRQPLNQLPLPRELISPHDPSLARIIHE